LRWLFGDILTKRSTLTALAVVGVILGWPLLSENAGSTCGALEDLAARQFEANLRADPTASPSALMWGNLVANGITALSRGKIAAARVKQAYPDFPPFLGCTILYYRHVTDPSLAYGVTPAPPVSLPDQRELNRPLDASRENPSVPISPGSPLAPVEPNAVTSPSPEISGTTASATPPIAPVPTGTGPVTMYDKGLADRTAWENWFNGLQGDFKTGAFFWAGQRSLPHPGSCSQMKADFYNGCTAAKERLATPDALRMSEPDYKRGWNAYASPGTTIGGTPAEAALPANSGGLPEDHKAAGRPRRQPASATVTPLLPSEQTAAGSNLPNPKCFTVYPAIPPADCFAH